MFTEGSGRLLKWKKTCGNSVSHMSQCWSLWFLRLVCFCQQTSFCGRLFCRFQVSQYDIPNSQETPSSPSAPKKKRKFSEPKERFWPHTSTLLPPHRFPLMFLKKSLFKKGIHLLLARILRGWYNCLFECRSKMWTHMFEVRKPLNVFVLSI